MRVALVCALLAVSAIAVAEPKGRALVIILDRSGSMQGLKIESAKDAAKAAVGKLKASDTVAVITFDSDATVVAKPQAPGKAVETAIAGIKPGGGTNILPALKEARALFHGISAKRKHVIVLSDGEAPTDGIADLVKEMRKEHVTVSAIGIAGADRNLLAQISEAGEGRLWMVEDLTALAKVFVKETEAGLK